MKAKFLSALTCSFALVMSLGLVACGGGNETVSTADDANTTAVIDGGDSEAGSLETGDDTYVPAGQYLDVSDVDFQSVDVSIGYGDYDAMSELAKDVENKSAVDKVVQIEGMMGAFSSKNLVLEPNSGGDEGVGVPIEVIGIAGYPRGGARVHLVGVIRSNSDGEGVIVVPSDRFAQVEEGDTVVKLSDVSVVVPESWKITKDDSPIELIIKRGSVTIEFWCGMKRANEVLEGHDDLWEWEAFNRTFQGYSRTSTEHVMVNHSLVITGSDIYLSDLKEFLEKNLVI